MLCTFSDYYRQHTLKQGWEWDEAQWHAAQALDHWLRVSCARPAPSGWRAWLGWHHRTASPRGFYLWGPPGRGKTYLLALCDQYLCDILGCRVKRVHFQTFMQALHAELHRLQRVSAPLEPLARRWAQAWDVLCFDEWYVEDIADAMLLGDVMRALSHHGLAWVITSNTPPHALYAGGLQRQAFMPTIDWIETHFTMHALQGSRDHRRAAALSQRIVPCATDTGSHERMRQVFVQWGGTPGEPAVYAVNHRPMSVHGCTDRMLWGSFQALCAEPRHYHDYQWIAQTFEHVLMGYVPVLYDNQAAAARRWVHWIDALYHAGVVLWMDVPSDAWPRLYQGAMLQSVCARTESRLVEMASPRWRPDRC